MKKKKKQSPIVPTLAALTIVGAVGGSYAWINRDTLLTKNNEDVSVESQITQEEWKLEDDTYTVTWEYPTSGTRTGKVGFAVELDEDQISSADITILTTNVESQAYQEDFKNELSEAVVGKKISELSDIDVIGGASGTTESFQEAVAALGEQLDI